MAQHCHDADALQRVIRDTRGLLVVDFHAPWCGPCRAIAPKLEDLAANYASEGLTVAKVDIDAVSTAAEDYGVTLLPTFVFYQDGVEIARTTGANINKIRRNILDRLHQ